MFSEEQVSYSKEPKSVSTFNKITFFHAVMIQSEAEDGYQLTSDLIKSAQKNVQLVTGSLL